MKNCIEIINVSRIYDEGRNKVTALNNINLSIKENCIFGIIGPNGAGKTTLIKLLTNLISPTSGTIKVLGYDISKNSKLISRHINYIYGGERGLYVRLSAYDNLKFFGRLYKIPTKVLYERIETLLKFVGLDEMKHKRVELFSKGMKQRLHIARGLLNDPEILFLDEPTIGLDPVGANQLHQLLFDLKKKGKTIIITTHYMNEVEKLCDNIALLKNGQILAINTIKGLKIQFLGNENVSLEDLFLYLNGEEND